AIVDLGDSEKGAYAVQGVPISAAGARLVAPAVHAAVPEVPGDASSPTLSSRIAAVNPGAAPADVTITYRGTGGSCSGQTITHPTYRAPAGGSADFFQGAEGAAAPTGPSGLPAGCTATAVIDAPGATIVAGVIDRGANLHA